MAQIISFTVPAVPCPQPRVRATNRGKHAGVYTPTTIGAKGNKRPHPIHAFKAAVMHRANAAYNGPPLSVPLRVDVLFVFPRHSNRVWKTKAMPRYWHVQKPDRDNLDKAVLDAMKGLIFTDDCLVCSGLIEKQHAAGDEQPHCRITITELLSTGGEG